MLVFGWAAFGVAGAQEITIVLDGVVPDDGLDHFRLPFEVPLGYAEIEVRHDDLSDANILDWGLDDPAGWRGWGGGNSESAVLNARAASRSYVPGPIGAGTWNVVVGKAQIAETPAPYHVEVVLRTEATLPPQERRPYVASEPLAPGPGWYAGDLHVHSSESGDAVASLDAIALAAAEAGLDFVVITDHNTVSHLDLLVDAQARHPDVLLIPGTEFTTYAGHANAIGVRGWVDHKLGQPGVTMEAAAEAYAQQGALLSINHPTLDLGDRCIGCAWSQPIPEQNLAAMEIGTGGWTPVGNLFTPSAIALWDGLCAEGRRIAAVGGSDDHRAGTSTDPFSSPIGSPTTMVWAESLSEQAILDGIAAGRTVVKLQDAADPLAALALEGTDATVTVTGGAGQALVWVVDGASAEALPIDADPFVATTPVGDGSRVRAEVWVLDAPRTVTSHLWAEVAAEPPAAEEKGCGCASGGAGGGSVLIGALLWLGRPSSRRRGNARRDR